MIIYTNFGNGQEVVFIVPPISEEHNDSTSLMQRFNERMTTGMYRYFSRSFVLHCDEITVYDPCTEQYMGLKNRRFPVDKTWKFGTIAARLKKNFELGTFHNGKEFSPFGDRTDFRTITVSPESTENLEEYLRTLDEIYHFF